MKTVPFASLKVVLSTRIILLFFSVVGGGSAFLHQHYLKFYVGKQMSNIICDASSVKNVPDFLRVHSGGPVLQLIKIVYWALIQLFAVH